jgi:hypothetical protein
MTDDVTDHDSTKGPLEQAIDVLVYAPIGLLFSGPSMLPKLVEEGRNQAKAGRMFGEFAVRQGRAELKRRLASFEEQAGETLRIIGSRDDNAPPPGPPGSGTPSSDGTPSATSSSPAGGTSAGAGVRTNGARSTGTGTLGGANGASASTATAAAVAPSPPVEDLAITDYDSLSASQVVTRLDGLGPDELEAVRAYEAAHRGRKTILNKVAQLQA